MDPFTELFNPSYWVRDPFEGTLHPVYLALGAAFALLALGWAAIAIWAPRLSRGHRLKVRLLRQMAAWYGALGALGLFWVLCRLIGSPLFARPLWFWLTILVLVAVTVYYVRFWRVRYPPLAQAYAEAERRRRWMPQPKRRAAARRR